jgi:hypothetical protein
MRILLALLPMFPVLLAAQPASADALGAERVGQFRQPVYVTSPPGAKRTLVVVERYGRIRRVVGGRIVRRPTCAGGCSSATRTRTRTSAGCSRSRFRPATRAPAASTTTTSTAPAASASTSCGGAAAACAASSTSAR